MPLLLIWQLRVLLWSHDKRSPGSFGIIIPHSPTKKLLVFIPDTSLSLSFSSHEGTPPPLQLVSEPWEGKREKDGAAPAPFQRVKVSLLADGLFMLQMSPGHYPEEAICPGCSCGAASSRSWPAGSIQAALSSSQTRPQCPVGPIERGGGAKSLE